MPSEIGARAPRIVADELVLSRPGAEGPLPVLDGVALAVEPGELVCVVGPSGCGKSTLLECLAGLRSADHGRALVDGTAAAAGRLALMPQTDALLPWRTLAENVAWGAKLAGADSADAAERAGRMIRRVGLAGFEDHFPHALSGGMRQRAALARTLVARAPGWLLDEPFGALDAITRADLHSLLSDLHAEHRPSVIMVTHDLDEALDLADRIVVLSDRPARNVAELTVSAGRQRRRSPEWAPERAVARDLLMDALGGRVVPA